MNFFRTHFLRFLLPLALVAVGAALCAVLIPAETEAVKQQLIGFPDSDVQAHQARPMILAALCFLPALAGFVYTWLVGDEVDITGETKAAAAEDILEI